MPTIEYRYDLDTPVAIIENNTVVACSVSQITLEADPTEDDMVTNEVTYHLQTLGSNIIHLRPEALVFPTTSEAVDYLNDPDNFVPSPYVSISISYAFALNTLVWTHYELSLISGNVTQVTFDVDKEIGTKRTRTFYHILPNVGTDFSSLERQDFEVFATDAEAAEYIKMISGITPTQTPTVTPTISVTPTPTPTITPTVTPTPSPSGSAFDQIDLDVAFYQDAGPPVINNYGFVIGQGGGTTPTTYAVGSNPAASISTLAAQSNQDTPEFSISVIFTHPAGTPTPVGSQLLVQIDGVQYTLERTVPSDANLSFYTLIDPGAETAYNYLLSENGNTVPVGFLYVEP